MYLLALLLGAALAAAGSGTDICLNKDYRIIKTDKIDGYLTVAARRWLVVDNNNCNTVAAFRTNQPCTTVNEPVQCDRTGAIESVTFGGYFHACVPTQTGNCTNLGTVSYCCNTAGL